MIRLVQPIIPRIPLLEKHLVESFEARQICNGGPAARDFAAWLCAWDGASLPVLASSCHAALMAAVHVVSNDPPSKNAWAVPAYTFRSTQEAVALQGLRPVYADVDPRTGCVTEETLAPVIRGCDGLLLVCPLSTIPSIDLQAVAGMLARARRAAESVIVDAAATFGTPPGQLRETRLRCVSFHGTKALPLGEGGAIFGASAEDASRCRDYLNFGLAKGDRGINGKMSDYAAAVGLALLEDGARDEIRARKANAHTYRARLGELVPTSAAGDETVYAVLPIFAPNALLAARVRKGLDAAGVEHRQYYKPLTPLPGAVSCYERNVCLPVHGGVSVEEVHRICDTILEAL